MRAGNIPETVRPVSSQCFDFRDEFHGMEMGGDCNVAAWPCIGAESQRFSVFDQLVYVSQSM
jgi:hypothetical protein